MSVYTHELHRYAEDDGMYYGVGFGGYAARRTTEQTVEPLVVTPEESRLAPKVADWDRTLLARQMAHQSMLRTVEETQNV